MTTFDDLLEEAGSFGRCQRRVFALLCLLPIIYAGAYIGIVFQGFTPDHWCRDSAVVARRESCGWSLADSRRLTVPFDNSSGVLQQSSCEQYEVDWNSTEFTCGTQGALNLSGAPVTACKDGWVYQYEGRKSFVTEFDLVCSDGWMVDMYQSIFGAGGLIGSFVFGYFADRFGRKLCFTVSNLVCAISGLVMAVVPNYISILVLRAIFGMAFKGSWMASYVLIAEIVGVGYRRTVGISYQLMFSVGVLVLPLFAYIITDWRWLQVAFSAPYILVLFYYWFIPESPRWLISQNNPSKAREVIDAMAKENKRTLKHFEEVTENEGDSPTASLLDLIRTPNMRKHTFILMFNWFTSTVVYQGLIMRVGIAGGNIYIDFFLSGLVEFPAAFLILFTIERIGRRLPFASANAIAGISCLIAAFIPDSRLWLKTVVACIGRLGITMAFEMVLFVNTEIYPTFVRNLGVSVCSILSDVGGIIAPFLLYRLAALWRELPLIIFGTVALIAGGLVLLLPETRGVPLPETIDDIELPDRKKENLENKQGKKPIIRPDDQETAL